MNAHLAPIEVVRWPQDDHTPDTLAIQVTEVAGIASKEEIGLSANRGQQDRSVFWIELETGRQLASPRRIHDCQSVGQPSQTIQGGRPLQSQISARFLNGVRRAQQLDVVELPESAQPGAFKVRS